MKYQQTCTTNGTKAAAAFYQGTNHSSNAKSMVPAAFVQKQPKAYLSQQVPNVCSTTIQSSKPPTRSHMAPCDPDIGFLSGAWLFDESCAPLWLLTQIPRKQRSIVNNIQNYPANPFVAKSSSKVATKPSPQVSRYLSEIRNWTPEVSFSSGSWLFSIDEAPVWLQKALSHDPTPQASIDELNNIKRVFQKAKNPPKNSRVQSSDATRQQKSRFDIRNYSPEDSITSGAWLFDLESAPEWFQLLVGTPLTAVSNRKPQYHSATRRITRRNRLITPQTSQELFESGAWLFDPTLCPSWLISQAPEVCTSRPSRSAKSFRSQSNFKHSCQPSNSTCGKTAPRMFAKSQQQGVGKCAINSKNACSTMSQSRNQCPPVFSYQESEIKTNTNACQVLSHQKQMLQHTQANFNSSHSSSNYNESAMYHHSSTHPSIDFHNCNVPPGPQWSNHGGKSNYQNSIPTASSNATGIGHGAYSIETSNSGSKTKRSQSARPQKNAVKQGIDNLDDTDSTNWMYFGEMRPNKVYLGRTKESKSASKEKRAKIY